ncbi:2-amino-4-hydroxy-6-hydroxymethyldihydropteridine diphosphokinase [Glaciimonas immobilis]|uniref:2-amino-4-hydroxy-6-hydroxymethyldihydropteridine pyrophosphokinase n=1 Tax=Glaciimonas immobilis TaxID=728004 RepID=A0A840RYJ9_9BURK|nr:2-amino-4-hydroxy-6-hydroxymethyldihydropteridine diphosphokinase [Glaciimonas immobilis]KAF3998601.1 2-amino-4-hydroxy-6-hydroxymethyldihydropteridine diphosphokinase [Glaciimonas immobilis]MBB5201459.1 2-amino-4-hydroxy-6-hydroxymethyldihydropteridine diphosphokinase [Glaciimonas immobilis]
MVEAPSVTAYIGIGANLGDAQGQVISAIVQLGALPQTTLSAQSSLFRTAPIASSGDDYVNAVVRLDTQLGPHALLQALQDIEQRFGRERPYPNAPRTLDLDLLLYGTMTIDDATLTVPHPRMMLRAFVLIPLLQIDPFITVPGQGDAHQFVPQIDDQAIAKI